MSENILSLNYKGINYEIKINLDKYPNFNNETNKILQNMHSLSKISSKSFIVKMSKKNVLHCKLWINYENNNIFNLIDIVKSTREFIDDLTLIIYINYQNDLLKKIIELNCFNELMLGKKYSSLQSLNNLTNVKTVKYDNHFYSNIKFLPKKIELMEIDIKNNSNIFIELPDELECMEYSNPCTLKLENIEFKNHSIKTILFINSNATVSYDELIKTEILVMNTNNESIDFTNIPNNIKIIYFNEGYKMNSSSLEYFPNSIEELNCAIRDNFNYNENTFMNLPTSVKRINYKIITRWNFKLFPILPDNIEHIKIYFETRCDGELDGINFFKIIKMPSNLKQLQINTFRGINDFSPNLINQLNTLKNENKFNLVIKSIFD